MQLFVPEFFLEGQSPSVPVCAIGIVLGVLLWLTGWWGHRFWIVLCTTVLAGLGGLIAGPICGMKPLVLSLLLAVSAGVLALALARLVAFGAAGAATCLAVFALAPRIWDEPMAWFLGGGLIGVLLFRLWTMTLTSFLGSLTAGYSLLFLLDRIGKINGALVAEQKAVLLNCACAAATVAGVVVQVLLERQRAANKKWKEEQERQMAEKHLEKLYNQRKTSWWTGRSRSRFGVPVEVFP